MTKHYYSMKEIEDDNPIFFKQSNMDAHGSSLPDYTVYGGRWFITHDKKAPGKDMKYSIWETSGNKNGINHTAYCSSLPEAKRTATKLARNRKFEAGSNLVELHVDLDGDLVIEIAPYDSAWQEVQEINEHPEWSRETIWAEVLDDVMCNSEYEWLNPKDIKKPTLVPLSAPLIGFEVDHDDYGDTKKVKYWWHRAYDMTDWVEELLKERKVIFQHG